MVVLAISWCVELSSKIHSVTVASVSMNQLSMPYGRVVIWMWFRRTLLYGIVAVQLASLTSRSCFHG